MIAEIIFGKPKRKLKADNAVNDLVEEFVIQLQKNGQVTGDEFSYDIIDGKLTAFVDIPEQNALHPTNYSDYGQKSLEKIIERFGSEPKWTIISDKKNVRLPNWKKSDYLVLFTHAFDSYSPICTASTGKPIPPYLLPLTSQEKEDVFRWTRSYRLHDNLWLDSGKLEIPAYKQLADPESQLSQEGREICRTIESKAGIKTFYFLFRYWGNLIGEDNRRCPSCGGSWRVNSIKNISNFWEFHFRCEPCRIVSNTAYSCDNPKYSHIGEFKQKTKNAPRKAGIK